MQPDQTDWEIINILREGHQPNNHIADVLGVSEGMVRRRIQRLKEAGILQIRALIDPDVLEHKQIAFIGVNVAESRLLEAKANELAALKDVQSVSLLSGRYDLLVEVLLDSNHGMVRFLTEELASIEGICRTESFLLLKSVNKRV